mmetsp:Transcript_5991/g.13135  ORF Transcript_5991/g.13135 Transcript_5991/m.13135 type:complete len:491 (-) Transcript_5991:146-1618(-)
MCRRRRLIDACVMCATAAHSISINVEASCFVSHHSSPPSSAPRRRRRRPIMSASPPPYHLHLATRSSQNEPEEVSPSNDLSDAEVLLACRAYLVRRKKLSWSASDRRKRAREQSLAITEGESGAVGYFWENPEELVYMKSSSSGGGDGASDGIAAAGAGAGLYGRRDKADDEEKGNGLLAVAWDGGDIWSDGVVEEEDEMGPMEEDEDSDRRRGGLYSDFLSGPSNEHEKRSNAQSEKWTDPQWKAMWYKRRWGENGEKRKSSEDKARKRLDSLIDSIPEEVLSSPELAQLSDDDIAEAVRIYVESRRKRSAPRSPAVPMERAPATQEEGELLSESTATPISEEDRLRAKQKERSERAKRAYETRRANAEKKRREVGDTNEEKIKIVMPSQLPHVFAAQEAMERIEWALYAKMPIAIDDIDLLLVPGRMSGRKDVLLRILDERFGLRGKCVPRDDGKVVFATNCPIDVLAEFVKIKLKESSSDKQDVTRM